MERREGNEKFYGAQRVFSGILIVIPWTHLKKNKYKEERENKTYNKKMIRISLSKIYLSYLFL